MKANILLTVLVAAMGCSQPRFAVDHGDLGDFILSQAKSRGARSLNQQATPIPATWRHFQDKDGVLIRFPVDQFVAVEAFLQQHFGSPSIPLQETMDGGRLGVYGVKTTGAGIQFGYEGEEAFVNILRPISASELIDHLNKLEK